MISSTYMDAIKKFEGFSARAVWDYAQNTNGYGTRARFSGEVIDEKEAERRFQTEISAAHAIVEKFAPDLDEGTKAALTSLTFNAGTAWTKSGLGQAIKNGDLDAAREIFLKYNKAGGETLPGLTSRRLAEVAWFEQSNKEAVANTATAAPIQATANAAIASISAEIRAQRYVTTNPLPNTAETYRSVATQLTTGAHSETHSPSTVGLTSAFVQHMSNRDWLTLLSALSAPEMKISPSDERQQQNKTEAQQDKSAVSARDATEL